MARHAPAETRPLAPAAGNSRRNGIAAIFVASLVFAGMAVCVRVACRDMPPSQVAFVRFAGALLVLTALGRHTSLRPRPGNLPGVLLRGLLGAAAILLWFEGIKRAGAAFATLLHCTYPVYTALIAATMLGEAFTRRLGLALILNLAGATLVLYPAASLDRATFVGGICAALAGMLAGGAVAAARHLRHTESSLLITTYFMAVGALLTLPSLALGLPEPSVRLVVALAGVVGTSVAGQLLLHHGLGSAGAIEGSLTAASSVASTAVLEAVLLGQPLPRNVLVGAAVLVGAVLLAAAGNRSRASRLRA
jgi:S-adenosylmethionine uptake transporter